MQKARLLFLRQDLFSIENAILASFETMDVTSGEATFIAALEQWLEAEGEGLDVEGDFNIGDLYSFAGDSNPELLAKYGVHNLTFDDLDNCKAIKSYDLNFKTSF